MRLRKILPVLLAFLSGMGCLKEEYSYEGGPAPPPADTTIGTDTLPHNTLPPLSCTLCSATTPLEAMQWRFLYGNVPLCGPVTKAVLSPEKNALTFFGPSACSVDTGVILTAFFDTLLNQDRSNVRASEAAFEYYNKNAADDVFRSRRVEGFSLLIDHYEAASRMAEGRFGGTAYTPGGVLVPVVSGTFRIRFE